MFRKMVAKEPEDRYQTMTEVVAALEACHTPGGPAAKAPPALPEDAQLSNFLRQLNAQGPVKPKVPSGPKSAKHGATVKAAESP